jgi:hypothetical protein
MTMPDRIQITHRPKTMSTPTIRAALDTFQQAANRGTAVYMSPELVQELRAALKAEQVAGEELLKLANGKRSQPGCPSPTPPSPVPGEVGKVAQWLHAHALDCRVLGRDDWAEQCTRAATLLQQQCAPPAPEPRLTFQDAIHLAEGCHDYSGGHSGAEGKAWHGAIDTVVAALKRAAIKPWDSQTRAVYGVGVEAQAGEVEA